MTISSAQSRMARALLYLKQGEAADASSIIQSQLSNFENPNSDYLLPSKALIALEQFYVSRGLEFLERDGVRRRAAGIVELKGKDGFKDFLFDVYKTVKNGGDVCVTNVDERLFEKWIGEYCKEYLHKMASVEGLYFRVLVQKGDTYFAASSHAVYKALPPEYFTGVPTYVYGAKKAEILFDEDTVTVFVIDNSRMAEAQRKLFDLAWEQASDPI